MGASLYLRPDGRWEARYKKGRNENGRLIYGFVYGKTQEEAEQKRAEILRKMLNEESTEESSALPSMNPDVSVISEINKLSNVSLKDRVQKPFSDDVVDILEHYFVNSDEGVALGAYLSLNLGLSLNEVLALKYGNIDLHSDIVTVDKALYIRHTGPYSVKVPKRNIVIPTKVRKHLIDLKVNERKQTFYVVTDSKDKITSLRTVTAKLKKIVHNSILISAGNLNALRSNFIKRCLLSNINIESVSLITGMDKTAIYRYFGEYIKADPNAILRLDTGAILKGADRKLNLLILGAGSHGHTVKEIAEKLGVFSKVSFLDDNSTNEDVVGKLDDYTRYLNEYPCAFVAFGDNAKRKEYAIKLKKTGYMLPHLIHPDATVSDSAEIGEGTIVMAQATVNPSTVGNLCIVASNALVNFGAEIKDYSHIDCAGIIMKDAKVPELTFVKTGEIFK